MKVIKYGVELDDDRKNCLVKEDSKYLPELDKLDSPQKISEMLNLIYNAEKKAEEYLWLIALNTKCKLIGMFEVSHGTISTSLAAPREIFIRLCLCGAAQFVVAHNHPSGECFPSREDLKLTKKLQECGKLMNIQLLDHIIVGDNNYYSFKENNNLKE